jgi:integrase
MKNPRAVAGTAPETHPGAAAETTPEFGGIYRVDGSPYLYYRFRHFGKPVRVSSGHADTTENRQKLCVFLNLIRDEISAGTFRYAETFPGDTEERKAFFSRLEGRRYRPAAGAVLFGDYARRWMATELKSYPEQTREDYESIIEFRLIPALGEDPFDRLNGKRIRAFLENLRHAEDGTKAGRYLAISSMRNILIPLRAIFKDACEEYGWTLQFPEQAVKRKLATVKRLLAEQVDAGSDRRREVFLLAEWLRLQPHLGDRYRPFFTVSLMTGLIFSELCGLRKERVKDGYLEIEEVRVRQRRKSCGKTPYRLRRIPLTARLRALLNEAMARSGDSDYVFAGEDGGPIVYSEMLKLWTAALTAAELPYRVPYALRHTIVEWSLLIGMDRSRLQSLIGHGSRKMIDEVYGSYREGLVSERTTILEFLGEDSLEPEELKAAHPLWYAEHHLLHSAHGTGTQPAPQAAQEVSQLIGALMANGVLTPQMLAVHLHGVTKNSDAFLGNAKEA